MKRIVKNTWSKKENLRQFTKLTTYQMLKIQGGTDETPPDECGPKKV